MPTLYVRKSGSDSNSYAQAQSPATAWLTIGKALTSAVSGDTVYIGAGIYRETVTVAMTSATSETSIIGDVDGSHTGDVGEVRWTGYTTDDKTAPSTSVTLNLAGRDYLTFRNIVFVGSGPTSSPSIVDASTTVISTNISFYDCTFLPGSNATRTFIKVIGSTTGGSPNNGITLNWVIDRCRFMRLNNKCIEITLPSADNTYTAGFSIQNCLFLGGGESDSTSGNACVNILTSGSLSQLAGDIRIYTCTALGGGTFVRASNSITTANPCRILQCVLLGCGNVAGTTGELVEDYNLILAASSGTNMSVGGNSKVNGSYSALFHIGQELAQGRYGRPVMTPTSDSPVLAFGSSSNISVDLLNAPRPSGPALTWTNTSLGIGCLEYGNCAQRETTTIYSSTSSIKIVGPGWHDFDFPVDASQTTISIYGRYNSSYGAATKPSMYVINGAEAGVADNSVTMGGAADTWTQMNLTFTPTSKGIVTIRLLSSTTAVAGIAYFDDFSVS